MKGFFCVHEDEKFILFVDVVGARGSLSRSTETLTAPRIIEPQTITTEESPTSTDVPSNTTTIEVCVYKCENTVTTTTSIDWDNNTVTIDTQDGTLDSGLDTESETKRESF